MRPAFLRRRTRAAGSLRRARRLASAKTLWQLQIGVERPCLVVIPCGVWHGVKNISAQPAMMLNAVDAAYDYEQPDHWRLPQSNPHIPFDFCQS